MVVDVAPKRTVLHSEPEKLDQPLIQAFQAQHIKNVAPYTNTRTELHIAGSCAPLSSRAA